MPVEIITGVAMNPQDLPLRDIHLPEAISWWPLAWGWWLLLVLGCAALFGVWWWWRGQRRRYQRLDSASYALMRLQQKYPLDSPELLRELSVLLRRIAISQYGREISGLTGKAWLEFLNQQAGKQIFDRRLAKMLTEAPYRRLDEKIDVRPLLTAMREWIKSQRGKKHV